ncbi:MAG: PaaI family thioesterase [Acidimicrobiales bacterium]
MAVHALENAAFGFPTACFVCDPDNSSGLRLTFTHDDETAVVASEFTLGPGYSGAPRFVHGGLVLAILDEAMAWAAIAVAGRFALSRTSKAGFRRPVLVGVPHRVEATVDEADDDAVRARARVLNPAGKRCAEASGRLVVLTAEAARSAIGADVGASSHYLRGGADGSEP